ncbi:MAG: hypothetical protein RBT11_14155 [Desulfobacterales bacterium]|jgi:hypothetical protein|nr:hypothetical protein [Desulfobacterales bacterium]
MYPIDASLGAYAASGLSGTYIPEIWAAKMLEKFYLSSVFPHISNTDYAGEITNMGDKVIIRTVPDVTIRDYKVGINLNYERLQSANVELLIDKGKYYAFPINDVEKKQSDINYMEKWSDDAGQQMKIVIDRDILGSVYADVDASNTGTTAGEISGDLNLGVAAADGSGAVEVTAATVIDTITKCGQALDEQNIPETGRWFVLPAWACQRIKNSELKDASLTGDGKSVLRNGRIGMIDRFEIYSSNNVLPVTETATKCYPAIFGHKSAITFASQLVKNETLKNPTDFGDLIRGLQVYGFEVIQPTAIGMLYCKPG